jgi:choline-phosphate cytidylyltransferase
MILNKFNLNNYKSYKYISEDNTFFTSLYKPLWKNLQKNIPIWIHPNIITLYGLLVIIIGYNFRNYSYGNYIMAFSIFTYLNCDAIDGIHAREINQMSIIGEYLDHLIDLISAGLISDALLEDNDIILKNLIISTGCLIFILPHYDSIIIKKMVFKNFSDISMILNLIIILFIFNVKLSLNYYFLISNIYSIYSLYKNNNNTISLLLGSYYSIKHLMLFQFPIIHSWMIPISDMLLLFQLINYKIFKIKMNILITIIPIIFIILPKTTISLIIIYIIDNIFKISNQLDINLFFVINKPKNVFCCGIFDLCHLGHMILFENIKKSFDEPINLIVGLHNDNDCIDYKRKPIINEEIRFQTIEHCKNVDKVINNTPLIITKNYILENNIDIVIIGEEYKNNKDKFWYPGAFELNNYKYIPRFTDISTSDIINYIRLNK